MFWFRYTRFLEAQNTILNQRIESLEKRNQELVIIISSRTYNEQPVAEKPQLKHHMVKSETRATCSCGWICNNDDPGKLQNAITAHYRDISVNRGRKSWVQAKTALEGASAPEGATKEN